MRFEEIRDALQPSIEDDLEALYRVYVEDTGTEDVDGFLALLHDGGMISDEAYQSLLGGTLDDVQVGDLSAAAPDRSRPLPAGEPAAAEAPEAEPDVPSDEPTADPAGDDATAAAQEPDGDDATAASGEPDSDAASEDPEPARAEAEPAQADAATDEPAADDASADADAAPAEPADAAAAATASDDATPPPAPTADGASADNTTWSADDDDGPTASNPAPTADASEASDASSETSDTSSEEEDEDDPATADDAAGQTGRRRRRRRRRTGEASADGSSTGRSTGARTGAQRRQIRTGTGEVESDTAARRQSAALRNETRRKTGIAGKGFEFVGRLGEGAMGEVLRAKDLDLNRVVAFKTMSSEIAKNTQLASKFLGEAQITAQLEHPNIVPIYSLEATPQGNLAYAMKMIRGKTFEDLIEECKKFYDEGRPLDDEHKLEAMLERFLDVCDAIHYAHQRGVVHRDLKPENLMVGPYNEVYVMDWGISKLMPPKDGRAFADPVTLVESPEDEGDMIIGTPQYMSPEQANGQNDTLDGHSDQYALGLILYEIVSLNQAVTGKAPLKIVMRQQDAEKNPLVHYSKKQSIDKGLEAIVAKTTQKDPARRYRDVAQLAEDIRRWLRDDEILARPDTLFQKAGRWVARHRQATLLAVLGLISVAAFVVIGLLVFNQIQRAQSYAREERVSELITKVGHRAAEIDAHFVRYEGLLGLIQSTASDMLSRGSLSEEPIYWATDYDDPEARPAETEAAPRYGMDVNFEHPAYFVPEGVERDDVWLSQQRIEPMQVHYKRVLLRSHSEGAATFTPNRARRLLGEVGVPLAWVHIGLENGLYVGYPGHGGFPDQYDPRKRPWYELAKGRRVPTWGAPYPDYFGLGAILPAAIGLYDPEGRFMGVAAVELTFDFIINELLEIDDLFNTQIPDDTRSESFLLDEKGQIVVRSSKKDVKVRGGQLTPRPLRMPEFPVPEVVDAIEKRESGQVLVDTPDGPQLVIYNRMNSLGWYYVVAGEPKVLLDANAQ